MDKRCITCGETKQEEDFPRDKTMRSGRKNICKSCVNLWKIKNPHRCRATRSISGHKLQGMNVKVTTSELEKLLETTTHCSICGIKLKSELNEGYFSNSPSVDRRNNEMELRLDNIWIVCRKCNATKQNRSMKEFYDYCKGVTEKFKSEFRGD